MKWKLARLMRDVGGWFGLVWTFLRVKLFLSTGTLKKQNRTSDTSYLKHVAAVNYI